MKRILSTGLAMISLCSVAQAQMPGAQRLEGKVSAVSDTSLTLANADGASEAVALLATRTVMVTAPVAVDQIQPGSYVATANTSQPDGTGVSVEIRVYPPQTSAFDVNRAMDAGGQTMMTNGRVAKAVGSATGRLLTVDYGAGSRQITVPPSVQVISNTPGTVALVKVGLPVKITTFPAAGDRPARQTITIAKADLAP